MKPQEIIEMKAAASTELSPFPTFSVDFIRVYRETEKDRYEPYQDIPLA
jgi:hypothetical protein